jgi:ATP-dependent exoDNAse (exonuclease V) alpha subunit
MRTAKLDDIVRQRDAALKQVVEHLAQGNVGEAVQGLERQGRVHEVKDQAERIAAIAKEYARQPENTLVVSPDNRSRAEINQAIRTELQRSNVVGREEHRADVLVPRQDLTGADRTWAERYQFNDVLLYSRNSKETGLQKGEYARVKSVDAAANQLTIVRADGSELTYDPRRQQGVSLYRDQEKAFSVGDRIQFTAPANDLKIANRELGTIQGFTDDGHMILKMDGGRSVSLDPLEHPHLDHGYAVTSHSSQGQTADRVLIHIDTELGAKDLLNNRMAYVAVSRGAQDAQIFTSDRQQLPQVLSREVSHQSAHVPEVQQEPERQQVRLTGRELVEQHARRWNPLNEALPEHEAKQFHWQQESGTIQSYKHTQTGRYLHIDGQAGTFHNQQREPITVKQALDSAMPEGQKHSHSLDIKPEREISIRGYGHGIGM